MEERRKEELKEQLNFVVSHISCMAVFVSECSFILIVVA